MLAGTREPPPASAAISHLGKNGVGKNGVRDRSIEKTVSDPVLAADAFFDAVEALPAFQTAVLQSHYTVAVSHEDV